MDTEQFRELKFRAWDKDKKQMFLVSDISFGDDGSARTIIFQTSPKGQYYRGLVHGESGFLMQFTGLLDNYNREMCVGDIVHYLDNTAKGLVEKIAVIEDIRHLPDFSCSKWQEVIGNIWETPELLAKSEVA